MTNRVERDTLVSVIVPVYNTAPYLERCIDSILAQTYPNWELILVDDGSTDNSKAICERYAKSDARIHLLSRENRGLSASRNDGMKMAQGEFISFVDSDDSIAPDTLRAAVDTLSRHPECDQVQYPSHKDIGSGRDYFCRYDRGPILGTIALVRAWMREREISWIPCDRIYRRGLLEGIKFKEGYYYEDALFSCMVALKSSGICFAQAGMYYYYTNSGSITQSYTPKKGQDKIDIHVEVSQLLRSSGVAFRTDAAFALYIVVNDMWASYMFHRRNNDVTDRGIDLMKEISVRDFLFESELSWRKRAKMLLVKCWSHVAQRYKTL